MQRTVFREERDMQQREGGSAAVVVMALLAGVCLAAANVAVLALVAKGAVNADLLGEIAQQAPAALGYLAASPVLLAVLLAVLPRSAAPAADQPATEAVAAAAPAAPAATAALRLLGLLQQEARFVDFIMEDIDAYGDAQIGAAARSIHAGCRKAITERMQLERVLLQDDGSAVTIDAGFDPAAIRLTGNVSGEPPFRGTLEHGGWRATSVSLPTAPGGGDASVIAPAEVEIA